MTLATYLRGIVSEARPLIEEWIALGEQFTGLREACKAKGLDWGQIKALIKAQVLDEKDNGERVAKIIEKADFASSYAAMLGLLPDNMNENNFSGTPLVPEQKATPGNIAEPAPRQEQAGTDTQAKASAGNGVENAPMEGGRGMSGEASRPSAGGGTGAPHPNVAPAIVRPEATEPRADSARTSPARGNPSDDDEGIPTWLQRGHPDCVVREQGSA